jgi:hypothetical protein
MRESIAVIGMKSYPNNVSSNLENGSFMLVIVVDEINEELNQIIGNYECSKSTFSLHGLEMNHTSIKQPWDSCSSLTRNSTKAAITGQKQSWNEERFLKAVAEETPQRMQNIARSFINGQEKMPIDGGLGKVRKLDLSRYISKGGKRSPIHSLHRWTSSIHFVTCLVHIQETLEQFYAE